MAYKIGFREISEQNITQTKSNTALKVYSHMFGARDREATQALGNIAFTVNEDSKTVVWMTCSEIAKSTISYKKRNPLSIVS